MSKTIRLFLIALIAIATLCGGVTFGLRAGYSQFASVTFGLVPALLILFPIVRERAEGKLTFAQWAGIILISALFAAVFSNLLAWLTKG